MRPEVHDTGNGEEIVHSAEMVNRRVSDKGYIQLALRSGQYKKLNVLAIKEGELIRYDPLDEDIEVKIIDDEVLRESTPTVGYYAFFEYLNGFKKTLYWSKDKMIAHADRFSQAFSRDACDINTRFGMKHKVSYADYAAGKYNKKDDWMYSSFWYKDFDAMAYKTMLRQLISKWGIMSIDMVTAFESDGTIESQDGTRSYVDLENPAVGKLPEPEPEPAAEAEPAMTPPEESAQDDGGDLEWD